jgi:hypothetical protein
MRVMNLAYSRSVRWAVVLRKAKEVSELRGVWVGTTIVASGPATSVIAASSVAGPPSIQPICHIEQWTIRS